MLVPARDGPHAYRRPTGYASRMTDREDLGHEPETTDDARFAPVTRGGDARGRTERPAGPARQEDETGGTGVPGVTAEGPDSLPPDEEGVRRAEEGDASRDHPH